MDKYKQGHVALFVLLFNHEVSYMDRNTTGHLKLGDPAEGPGSGTCCTPVAELPVLARVHEVLAPPIAGMLVQGPVAVHHVAGVDVPVAEVLLHGLAVVAKLHHLALEVRTLIDAQAVLPPAVLWGKSKERILRSKPCNTILLCLTIDVCITVNNGLKTTPKPQEQMESFRLFIVLNNGLLSKSLFQASQECSIN